MEWHFIGQRHIEIKDFEGIFEKSADKNSVKIFLGDNRGTKIKREIPQPLNFNELRD